MASSREGSLEVRGNKNGYDVNTTNSYEKAQDETRKRRAMVIWSGVNDGE